ncbi:MAG TPA: WGxxGxxG family protein [Leptolyngbyaceae cyanobacterium]
MKLVNFSKTALGTGLLALSLTMLPASLPAAAQSNANNNPTVDTTPFQESTNDFNNFGWLGLVGLLGLLNLLRKPKTQHHDTHTVPDATVSRTTYRD